MATKANRYVDAAHVGRSQDEYSAQRHLAAIVEASGDAIIRLTPNGVIETWNQSAERLYGYSAEEAVGKHALALLARDPAEREAMLARVAAGSEPAQTECQDIRKDGSLLDVSETNTPIRDPRGRVIGIARIARDVTARVEAEAALSAANARLASTNAGLESSNALLRQAAELSRSNAELEQFASVASHDLQEPLRKVQTFAVQLTASEHDRLSVEGQDFLRRMTDAAARMRTLIDDLLMFSRVSTKGRPFVAVDLGEIVAEVLLHLELSIKESGARVTVDALPTVEADPVQMRQLLQNLLGNALKFRHEGVVPDVRVSVELTDHVAQLTVKDNGIGFDEQYATRIFGAFERLHGTRDYAGTGIGLALCRKIIERHHGTITANSELGNGATFTVTLPIEQTSEGAAVTSLFPEIIDQEVSHAHA